MWDKRIFRIFGMLVAFCFASILFVHDTKIRKMENQTQRITLSRDAFVQLTVYLDIGGNDPLIFKGSGTLIKKAEGSNYVLSANHLCTPSVPQFLNAKSEEPEFVITDFSGEKYEAHVVFNSIQNDLCLIRFDGYTNATAAPIASSPVGLNEKIYVFAAPTGFFAPHVIPLFEGQYSGDIIQFNEVSSVYTFPATGGSSGAAILNSDGEVVGVVHSVLSDFHHISLASTHESVRDLLFEYSLLSNVILLEP